MTYVAPSMDRPATPYGGFWLRFGAAIADTLIVIVPCVLVLLVLPIDGFVVQEAPDPAGGATRTYSFSAPGSLVFGLMFAAYKAVLESSPGRATWGKRAAKLVVTDEMGERVSFATALYRGWPTWLPFVLFLEPVNIIVWIVAMISCIAVAPSDRKQGLHDRMAACLVVKRDAKFTRVDL